MSDVRPDDSTEDHVTLYLEGCDLEPGEPEFVLPTGGWRRLLTLAQIYGWRPAGTEAPEYPWMDAFDGDDREIYWMGEPSEWDGRYFPGYLQHVTKEDARALSAALRRALPDLSDHDLFEGEQEPRVGSRTSSFALYNGPRKDVLRSLVDHCLECAGGFWIWSWEGPDSAGAG